MLTRRGLLSIPLLAAGAGRGLAGEWPRFRGPSGNGVPDDEAGFPDQWGPVRNVAWKSAVDGSGWSSPVSSGGRVFLASAVGEPRGAAPEGGFYEGGVESPKADHAIQWKCHCFDLGTGELRWQADLHRGVPTVGRHRKNTYASETCVTDGERVYAHVGDLGTWCLDFEGRLLWSRRWEPVRTRWGYGTASSPALHGDRLYIVNDHEGRSYLQALDRRTGKQVWRAERDEPTTWSTPLVWQNEDRVEIVTVGRERVRSYDTDGRLLWQLGNLSALAIPSPFHAGGLLYVTSGYMRSEHRPIYAIRPGATGDITLPKGETSSRHVAWSVPQGGPYHPSGLVYRGLYYTLFDRGFLTCHDAATGEEVYGKRRISRDAANFTASPWAYNGKVFCLDEAGTAFVVAAGPEFRLLRANRLNEMCMATPALVERGLLVRTHSSLYRIAG